MAWKTLKELEEHVWKKLKNIENLKMKDWRPAEPIFLPELKKGIDNAIIMWFENGDKIIYIDGEEEKATDWNFDLSEAVHMNRYPVLVVDESGDNPYVFVTIALRFRNEWIVDNDYPHGRVVAFQPLPNALSLKEIEAQPKKIKKLDTPF